MPQLFDTSPPCQSLNLDTLFLQGVSGSIGSYTFKQINGQTYYSKRVTTIKSKTPKQLRQRAKFVLARKFQKHVLANPYLKSQYLKHFNNLKSKYHRLCDWLIGAFLKNQLPIITQPLSYTHIPSLYLPYTIETISPKDHFYVPPLNYPFKYCLPFPVVA